MTAPDLIAAGYSLVGTGTVKSATLYPTAPAARAAGQDFVAMAEAYRTERARYWVRRKTVGEATTPGGTVATIVTQVLNDDQSEVLFTGEEPAAKAWLDQTCLRAALRHLLAGPSETLLEAAGGMTALQRVVLALVTQD